MMIDAPNVRRIHEEPAPASGEATGEATGEELAEPAPKEPAPARAAAPSAEEVASSGLLGFESPFEDELDTPAFLRKRGRGAPDDPDVPAFMRRGNGD